MAQTIKENALEIVSANTNGFIRIVGENGLSYRVAVQDFINLVGNNQTITELIQEEALARESADNDLADEITDIKADLEHLSGVPTNVRQAMLTLFESAAYTTTGLEDEIAAIESWAEEITSITLNDSIVTLNGSETHQLVATTVPAGGSVVWSTSDSSVATVSNTGLVTSIGNGEATITASSGSVSATCEVTVSGFVTLESISAVYTQTVAVYETDSLDSLKSDLVVTATYDDSTTATVTNYTLSGTLEEGTSTITVTYGGKTDTFDVVVSGYLPSGYTAYDYVVPVVSFGNQIQGRAIVTDAQLSTDYIISAKIYFPDTTGGTGNGQALFGTRSGQSGAKQIGLFHKYSAGKYGYWYDGTDSTVAPNLIKGAVNNIKIQPVGVGSLYPAYATLDINGTEYNLQSQSTGVTFESWFGIYSYAIAEDTLNSNSVYWNGQQIGEIEVTDLNGNVIYDFIPAKDSSNRYGYYERKNEKFYYNETYAVNDYTGGYWT